MNNFLKNVMEGSGITPSGICLHAFNQNFENAINVEWFNKKKYFEAVFYKDNLEHIATFSLDGDLIEYRLYLPEGYLPLPLKTKVQLKGEIMNSVLRNKGNRLEYEIIYRDAALTRFLITLSDLGAVLEEKKL